VERGNEGRHSHIGSFLHSAGRLGEPIDEEPPIQAKNSGIVAGAPIVQAYDDRRSHHRGGCSSGCWVVLPVHPAETEHSSRQFAATSRPGCDRMVLDGDATSADSETGFVNPLLRWEW
jgi:hypothetical protein